MNHDIRIKPIFEHWEVFVDGKFYCSADSFSEAWEEARELEKSGIFSVDKIAK